MSHAFWQQCLYDSGDGQFLSHSHPDRSLLQARAGQLLIYKRKHRLTSKAFEQRLCTRTRRTACDGSDR